MGQENRRSRRQQFNDLLVGHAAHLVVSWTCLSIMLTQAGAPARVWVIVGVASTFNALYYSDEIADIGRILREDGKMRRTGIKEGTHHYSRLIKSGSMGDDTPAGDRIELVDGGEYDLFVKYGLGEDGDKNEQQGENHVQQRCQQCE